MHNIENRFNPLDFPVIVRNTANILVVNTQVLHTLGESLLMFYLCQHHPSFEIPNKTYVQKKRK